MLNINNPLLDDLAHRIGKTLEHSPAKDIERNVKAMLQGALGRIDLVTRAEFDVQAQVLARTREKLERLETSVAELERLAGPPAASGRPPPPPVPAQ